MREMPRRTIMGAAKTASDGEEESMQCNIDERGARFRLVWGIMNLMVGLLLGGLAAWSAIWWLWLIAAAAAAAGFFAIFEARKKWCVLRAMGVKTRM